MPYASEFKKTEKSFLTNTENETELDVEVPSTSFTERLDEEIDADLTELRTHLQAIISGALPGFYEFQQAGYNLLYPKKVDIDALQARVNTMQIPALIQPQYTLLEQAANAFLDRFRRFRKESDLHNNALEFIKLRLEVNKAGWDEPQNRNYHQALKHGNRLSGYLSGALDLMSLLNENVERQTPWETTRQANYDVLLNELLPVNADAHNNQYAAKTRGNLTGKQPDNIKFNAIVDSVTLDERIAREALSAEIERLSARLLSGITLTRNYAEKPDKTGETSGIKRDIDFLCQVLQSVIPVVQYAGQQIQPETYQSLRQKEARTTLETVTHELGNVWNTLGQKMQGAKASVQTLSDKGNKNKHRIVHALPGSTASDKNGDSHNINKAVFQVGIRLLDKIQQTTSDMHKAIQTSRPLQQTVSHYSELDEMLSCMPHNSILDAKLRAESGRWRQKAEESKEQLQHVLGTITTLSDESMKQKYLSALREELNAVTHPLASNTIIRDFDTQVKATVEGLSGIQKAQGQALLRLSEPGQAGGKELDKQTVSWLQQLKGIKDNLKTGITQATGQSINNFSPQGMLARWMAEWSEAEKQRYLGTLSAEGRAVTEKHYDNVFFEVIQHYLPQLSKESDPQGERLLQRLRLEVGNAAQGTTLYPATMVDILAGMKSREQAIRDWSERKLIRGAFLAVCLGGFKLLPNLAAFPLRLPIKFAITGAKVAWGAHKGRQGIRGGEGDISDEIAEYAKQSYKTAAIKIVLSLPPGLATTLGIASIVWDVYEGGLKGAGEKVAKHIIGEAPWRGLDTGTRTAAEAYATTLIEAAITEEKITSASHSSPLQPQMDIKLFSDERDPADQLEYNEKQVSSLNAKSSESQDHARHDLEVKVTHATSRFDYSDQDAAKLRKRNKRQAEYELEFYAPTFNQAMVSWLKDRGLSNSDDDIAVYHQVFSSMSTNTDLAELRMALDEDYPSQLRYTYALVSRLEVKSWPIDFHAVKNQIEIDKTQGKYDKAVDKMNILISLVHVDNPNLHELLKKDLSQLEKMYSERHQLHIELEKYEAHVESLKDGAGPVIQRYINTERYKSKQIIKDLKLRLYDIQRKINAIERAKSIELEVDKSKMDLNAKIEEVSLPQVPLAADNVEWKKLNTQAKETLDQLILSKLSGHGFKTDSINLDQICTVRFIQGGASAGGVSFSRTNQKFSLRQILLGETDRSVFIHLGGSQLISNITGNQSDLNKFLQDKNKRLSIADAVMSDVKKTLQQLPEDAVVLDSFKASALGNMINTLANNAKNIANQEPIYKHIVNSFLDCTVQPEAVLFKGNVVPELFSLGSGDYRVMISVKNSEVLFFNAYTENDKLSGFIKEHLSLIEQGGFTNADVQPIMHKDDRLTQKWDHRLVTIEMSPNIQRPASPVSDHYYLVFRANTERMLSNLGGVIYTSDEKRKKLDNDMSKALVQSGDLLLMLATSGSSAMVKTLTGLASGVGFGLTDIYLDKQLADNADRYEDLVQAQQSMLLGKIFLGINVGVPLLSSIKGSGAGLDVLTEIVSSGKKRISTQSGLLKNTFDVEYGAIIPAKGRQTYYPLGVAQPGSLGTKPSPTPMPGASKPVTATTPPPMPGASKSVTATPPPPPPMPGASKSVTATPPPPPPMSETLQSTQYLSSRKTGQRPGISRPSGAAKVYGPKEPKIPNGIDAVRAGELRGFVDSNNIPMNLPSREKIYCEKYANFKKWNDSIVTGRKKFVQFYTKPHEKTLKTKEYIERYVEVETTSKKTPYINSEGGLTELNGNGVDIKIKNENNVPYQFRVSDDGEVLVVDSMWRGLDVKGSGDALRMNELQGEFIKNNPKLCEKIKYITQETIANEKTMEVVRQIRSPMEWAKPGTKPLFLTPDGPTADAFRAMLTTPNVQPTARMLSTYPDMGKVITEIRIQSGERITLVLGPRAAQQQKQLVLPMNPSLEPRPLPLGDTEGISVAKLLGPDFAFSHDTTRKGTLYIQAHGFPSNVNHQQTSKLAKGIKILAPDVGMSFTKTEGKVQVNNVVLYSCYGGAFGRYSTGQVLADELQVPVRAYRRKIGPASSDRGVVFQPREQGSRAARRDALINNIIFHASERVLALRRGLNAAQGAIRPTSLSLDSFLGNAVDAFEGRSYGDVSASHISLESWNSLAGAGYRFRKRHHHSEPTLEEYSFSVISAIKNDKLLWNYFLNISIE